MTLNAHEELLLALDTSGDLCSIAALRGGVCVSEHLWRHEMHLSERLMGQIDTVLHEVEATLEAVNAFAVGIGPGSFTGTRIGVMTIKTLADVLARPVYGIDGLAAIAAAYTGLVETAVIPMLPCRTDIVFTGAYEVGGEQPQDLWPADALPISELAERIRQMPPQPICICGAAAPRYREALQALLPERRSLSFGAKAFPAASQVGRLAWLRRSLGDPGDDVLSLVPHYISPPPITLPRGVTG